MDISDFLLKEAPIGFKSYSKYVLYSRAIPSMVDGFKPSQRKIIYTANLDPNKLIKTAAFAGKVVANANYHHGAVSLEAAINGMAADWNNNMPFMFGDGAFGSRLVPEAASPRYTSCQLSQNFFKYFPEIDNDILPKCEDALDPEPRYYIPTLPTVLFNGIKGISVGFATTIFPYDVGNIRSIVKKIIKGKKIPKRILPKFPEFKGEVVIEGDRVICKGIYEMSGNNITITEIPPEITREKYLIHLETLYQNRKIISYEDLCDKNGFKFKAKIRGKHNIPKLFKLEKKYSENITVISPKNTIKIYDNPIDLIVDFVEFRLGVYQERKEYLINKYKSDISFKENMLRFVENVVNNNIVFKGKIRKTMEKELAAMEYSSIGKLLNLSIFNLTQDKILELKKEIAEINEELSKIIEVSPENMYLGEI
jgi:DNA gyrase/topoisomerase IV subunit A